MDRNSKITFLILLYSFFSCNSLIQNDKIILTEESLYINSYIMEQQTKVNYNYIVTNQIADSSNDSIISKEIILLKDLIKIEATVKKIVSKYRSQLFASIFENKNIYPDTVMLKNIKGIKYDLQSDEIVTKFFNNDFPIIQLEYAKMLKICGSEYGLIGDVKEIWETEPKSAVDFVANLTLTQNLFTSHINYVSLRIIQNHQIQ